MSNTTTVLSTIPATPAAPPATAAPDTPAATTEGETPAADPSVVAPGPATTEPEKKTEPDPDLVIAQKLEGVAKREARARKMESQWQSKFAELEAMKADLAKKLADAEAALEDPVEYYLKKGKDPVEVMKRAAKPVTEEEKRLARLEAAEEERKAEREKQAEESRKREQSVAQRQFWARFVGEIDPAEYPHLTAVHKPTAIPDLVHALLNRPHDPSDPESPTVRQVFRAQYDRDPTPKELRDALEHEAEEHAMSLIERLKPKASPAPSQATPPTPPATEESTSLSNQHAASSPSARTSTETREERVKRLKEELLAEEATK